jgi:hypothetical protein
MKKLLIISSIALSGLIFGTANAQPRFRFAVHIRPQIVVAPAPVVVEQAPAYQQPVYDNTAVPYDQTQVADNGDSDYYYLPDVDAYYDVNAQCYYYYDGGNWISAAYLPGGYSTYDWRTAPHYEIRAARPYLHADFYRGKYQGHAVSQWAGNNYHPAYNGNAGRPQNVYNRPVQTAQYNRFQPAGEQHSDNRPQGNFARPEARGGSEHFQQVSQRGNNAGRRMSKF